MHWSPPVSYVHGVLQARILEWVATLFSRGSSWPRDRTQVTHVTSRFFTVWATWGTLIIGRFYYTSSWISSQTSWGAGPGIPLLKCCLRDCFTGSLRLLGYDIGQFSNPFDSWTLFSVKVNEPQKWKSFLEFYVIYEVVSSKGNCRLVHSNVVMFILSTVFIICKKILFFPFYRHTICVMINMAYYLCSVMTNLELKVVWGPNIKCRLKFKYGLKVDF